MTMTTRFVIPAGANPDSQAWDHRSETWAELASQAGEPVIIETIGSQWCVENNIGGLGFCTESSGPFENVEVGR